MKLPFTFQMKLMSFELEFYHRYRENPGVPPQTASFEWQRPERDQRKCETGAFLQKAKNPRNRRALPRKKLRETDETRVRDVLVSSRGRKSQKLSMRISEPSRSGTAQMPSPVRCDWLVLPLRVLACIQVVRLARSEEAISKLNQVSGRRAFEFQSGIC
jgi:hypothetical protein